MEYLSNSAQETKKFASKLAKGLKGGEVIALYGDLGSGKTTFVQGLVKSLGGKQREVISPTFIIQKEYRVKTLVERVFHIDLYRLESIDEIEDLGLIDYFGNKDNLVVIEWAEKAKELLPKEKVEVCFEYLDENRRKINVFIS